MKRLEEIEAAINDLPPADFRQIAEWIRERDQMLWDQRLDNDSATGRLDSLFKEAEVDLQEGHVRDWPASR